MVGHLLKIGTYHWIPHWKCTEICPSISVLVGQILKLVGKWPTAISSTEYTAIYV